MALTKANVREILSLAGVDAEKIAETTAKIIQGHTDSIEALREERDNYKAEAARVAQLEADNAKMAEQLKGYEGKDYDALKKEYEEYKDGIAKKEVRAKKEAAYSKILKDAGVNAKHYQKILKYSDVDGLELDENGDAKNAPELLKAIKTEWADHIETTEKKGAEVPTPPEGAAAGTPDTSYASKRVAQYVAERYGSASKKEE